MNLILPAAPNQLFMIYFSWLLNKVHKCIEPYFTERLSFHKRTWYTNNYCLIKKIRFLNFVELLNMHTECERCRQNATFNNNIAEITVVHSREIKFTPALPPNLHLRRNNNLKFNLFSQQFDIYVAASMWFVLSLSEFRRYKSCMQRRPVAHVRTRVHRKCEKKKMLLPISHTQRPLSFLIATNVVFCLFQGRTVTLF